MNIGKIIAGLAGRVDYWLRAAELATATGGGALAAWVISQLEIRAADRILEIGCGPDMVMKNILKAHKDVFVAAVDHTPALIEQTWRKNARAIGGGRAMLIQTDAARGLPAFAVPFTKAVAVNAAILAERPAETIKTMRSAMVPRGKIVLAFEPGDNGTDLRRLGREFRSQLAAAGFTSLWVNERTGGPASAVCITGLSPAPAGEARHTGRHHHE